MCSAHTSTFHDNDGLFNSLHNNLSCLASAAPQADSWWLGHVESDDVVIADIVGQALDIFLHGPESAHKNGVVKTFTHTSIPIRPCTHLKEEKKLKNEKTKHTKKHEQHAELTKHDAFVYWSSSCPVWLWSTFRKLGTFSNWEALSPRTVLIENICESAQQILQNKPGNKALSNNLHINRSTHAHS